MTQSKDEFLLKAQKFIEEMPYKESPYNSRNWGNPWHSLCSYHGKLKPAIAHHLILNFSSPGDTVLDPLCGVGTIPFEACLQGRIGIGNDLSDLAYAVTKAKLDKPDLCECQKKLDELNEFIEKNIKSDYVKKELKIVSTFGYNRNISEYFHQDTLKEIICARLFFKEKNNKLSSSEAMILSCLLHVLHGNRPYALSRQSHPLTPYAPTGDFVYKNLIEHVNNKLRLSFDKWNCDEYVKGKAIFGNFSDLTNYDFRADTVICSPPFAGSIRFYMQNWLRLWLCGWNKKDFDDADLRFLDQKQKKNFDVYSDFFKTIDMMLKPSGTVILHLGKTSKIDMATELSSRASPYFKEIYRGEENVEKIEKHGIKDKGATLIHQFLFLQK